MHHIPSFLSLMIESWYVFWAVLKVAVHHDNIFALGIAQTSRDGIVLTEIATQVKTDDTLINGTNLTDGFPHIVWRAVIDENNLVTVCQRL